ncbi:hypothetical protein LCGC14_1079350, partial [marine sediment metagenome]
MARKDLLKGLMAPPPPGAAGHADATTKANAPAAPVKRPARPAKGAIGAVSQSIAELRTRAFTEVPADMIDGAGLKDRLGDDDEGLARLEQSLLTHGQKMPVLLRHSPNDEGRYEVIYGRRRIAALRRLRLPVKALIQNMSDRELILAQGLENSARRDLSFVEKANFARQMIDMGYDRAFVGEALHVDKTVVSRLLSIAARVPVALIVAIGPAPAAGRTRWSELAALLETRADGGAGLVAAAEGAGSDQRFEAVLRAVQRHFNPGEDFALIPRAPLDTLDFTGVRMHYGSKMILDATPKADQPPAGAPPPMSVDPSAAWRQVRSWRLLA